jgi:hypothetical protein
MAGQEQGNKRMVLIRKEMTNGHLNPPTNGTANHDQPAPDRRWSRAPVDGLTGGSPLPGHLGAESGQTAPRGPIPCVKIGRAVRYSLRDLEQYVEG